MKRAFYLLMLVPICLWTIGSRAQVLIEATSGSCVCDGSISFSTGTNTNTFYEWTDATGQIISQEINNTGSSQIFGQCPGIFYLTVDLGQGSQSMLFNIPGPISPGTATEIDICETSGNFNLANLLPDITAGGIWTDGSGAVVNPVQNASLLNGENIFYYTLEDGPCSIQTAAEVSIIENADPGQSTTYLICENYNSFFMTDLLAGSPDLGGLWLDALGQTVDGWYHPATMEGELFTYMLDVVDGCNPVFASLFVIENHLPDAGTSSSEIICSNGPSVDMFSLLGGSPDSGGQWFDPLGLMVDETFVPNLELTGDYTYLVLGDTPCPAISTQLNLTITQINPAGTGGSVTICESSSPLELVEVLEGEPVLDGVWTDPDGNTFNGTFDPISTTSGMFQYDVQISTCAPESSTLLVNIETLAEAGPGGSLTFCESDQIINLGDYLEATVQTGGIWTLDGDVIPNSNMDLLSTGDYLVTYEVVAQFCPDDEALFNVTVEEAPIPISDLNLSFCQATTNINLYEISGYDSAAVFTDDQNNTISEFFPLGETGNVDIFVSIPSGNVCPAEEALITIAIEGNTDGQMILEEVCSSMGVFDLNETLGTELVQSGYWTDADGEVVDPMIELSLEESVNYFFNHDSINTCGIGVYPLLLAVFSPHFAGNDASLTLCSNAETTSWPLALLQADAGGAWSFEGTTVDAPLLDPASAPSGDYLYLVESNGPCPSDNALLSLIIAQPMNFDAGEDLAHCDGNPDASIGQVAVEGCSYVWTPSTFLSDSQVSEPMVSFQNSSSEVATLSYVVSASDGTCFTYDTLQITVYPKPDVSIGNIDPFCHGEVVGLHANGNATHFAWQPSEILGTTDTPEVSWTAGDNLLIQVQATNDWGCTATDSLSVSIEPSPYLIVSDLPGISCAPSEMNITVLDTTGTAVSFAWIIDNEQVGSGPSLVYSIENPGEYDIQVLGVNAAGCSATSTNPIQVEASPVASFSYTPEFLSTLENIASFTNNSLNYNSIEWHLWNGDLLGTEEFSYTFSNEAEASYEVCLIASNSAGCIDDACETIHISNEVAFYAPNAFTPDNDGLNDNFEVSMTGFDPNHYHLQILDRWGVVVFDTTNPEEVWTGNRNGGNHYVPNGSYVWVVNLKEELSADELRITGVITVVR